MRIQLSFRAEKLPNIAGRFRGRFGGIADPYAVIKVSGGDRDGEVIGRTETVMDSVTLEWAEIFIIDEYETETVLPLTVSIYHEKHPSEDEEPEGDDDGENPLLAEADFEVSAAFESPHRTQSVETDKGATVFMQVSESLLGDVTGSMAFQMRGLRIKNVEEGLLGLGRSDPFYEISKKFVNHASGYMCWQPVCRSEAVTDDLNPVWESRELDVEKLCHGDLDWPLQITVYDWQKRGRHRIIGSFEVTPNMLIEGKSVKGNADLDKAFALKKDDDFVGHVVVLVADIGN